jgi:hypothetical protein
MQHDVQPFIIRWIYSFLSNRQQRVEINSVTSNWATMNGGMFQGTWLDPYVFLININDLQTIQPTFKFIEDVTVTEVTDQPESSQMQTAIDTIATWSTDNHINVKYLKNDGKCSSTLQNHL